MRTTVTLDDDLAARVKALASKRKVSFKEALNEAIRRGLSSQTTQTKRREVEVLTFRSAFRPGIDPEKLNQLGDDLEIEPG